MANLLAILVSLAMLLTGGTTAATPETPVGRVVTIGNLQVSHNEDDADLDLYATLGVTTDGAQTLYDFFIGDDDETYLPFQLSATENSLLMRNDKDGQTLALTAADLEKLFGDTLGGAGDGTAMLNDMLNAYAKMLPAYADMLAIMADEDEMTTLRRRSWEIYDKTVERGEGAPGKVEYDGELYDVMTYEYTLDGGQLGALADAVYASDPRLKGFSDAYFDFLAQMPEDLAELGLSGANSYEALLKNFDIAMRVSESIADNGLVMMDGKLTVAPPAVTGTEPIGPIAYNVHQARMEDDEYTTVTFDVPVTGMLLSCYVEYSRDNGDSHVTYTVSGNPEDGAAGDGEVEGDGEDALYITLDYDETRGDDMIERYASGTLDAEGDIHLDFTLEADHDAEGAGVSHIACNANIGEERYAVDFDVVATNETVEQRVSGEDAVALADYNFPALMANLGEDFSQLMDSPDVQTLVGMFPQTTQPAMDAPAETEEPEAEEETAEGLSFANPKFDWLPEGFTVEDIDVDEQYEDVTCMLVNAETGDTITVDLTTSAYEDDGMHYYVVKDDGFKAVDGLLISEEDYEDYYLYSADDGKVSYLIYPDSKDIPYTDIMNLLIGLHFE